MSSKVVKRPLRLPASPVSWQPADSAARPPQRESEEPPGRQALDPEVIAAEAYQRGYREGEAAGRRAVEPALAQLAQSIDALASLRPRLRKQAEADVLQLSLAIARRVLRRELNVDPAAVSGLIRVALEKLEGQEIQRVRVHPALESSLRNCLRQAGAPPSLEIIAESNRQPGDVVFETPHGNLDASVETQLAEIERGLADRLRHH